MNYKNLFLFYLVFLFCCNVGESVCKIKARGQASYVLYFKCGSLGAFVELGGGVDDGLV